MKAFTKLGPGMAPASDEDAYASEAPWSASTGRGPAPAGALQRSYPADFPETEDDVVGEEPYKPARGRVGFRVRGALRSKTGRIVLGSMAFVAVCAVAGTAYATHRFLLHDERFVIPASSQIETIGNTHLTRAQLLSVFGEDVERNIFKVPLAQRRADLENLPWVRHATVMRLLPNTLRIAVTERTPVAFVRQGTQIGLVDASGVLLDMPASDAGDPHYSFPVLTGISIADPLSTRAARMEIYRKFMQDLDSSGEKVTEQLSEVDVTSPEDVKAVIPANGLDILVHFGDEDFLTRYRHFKDHLPEWKQQYPHLASADMRYDRQVVLEMTPGTVVPNNEAIASNAGDAKLVAAKAAARVSEKSAPAKAVPAKAAPVKVAAKTMEAPVVRAAKASPAKSVSGPGKSAANAKMFAALAAAHKAQVEESKQGPR